MKTLQGILALVAGVTMIGAVQATVINVDVSDKVSSYSGTGASPDTGIFWNIATGNPVNGTLSNLTASDGTTATAVDVGFRNWTNEFEWVGALPINDRYYGAASGLAYIDIMGLAAGEKYDLYLYASYHSAEYSVPGLATETANPGQCNSCAASGLPWVEGIQYVLLEGAMADALGDITVTVNSVGSGLTWTNIAGIQIADASSSVPVPATLALFGLGLAGLGWSKRKKV